MNQIEVKTDIATLILEMEKPFRLSDLFTRCEQNLNVHNRELILDVLDELCDCGAIEYSEINDDCWAFIPCA